MNTPHSPPFAELLDWLEGRLPPERAQAVAERLQKPEEATEADLAWLRAFAAARGSVKLAASPASVRDTLRQRFAQRSQAAPQPPSLFQRWVAALSFDSRRSAATAGLRSAAAEGQARQLIYTTEAAEVVLNTQPGQAGPGFTVLGQVFAAAEAPAGPLSVQVLREGEEAALTVTDELGEFVVDGLAAGVYEVVVSAAGYEVVIPAVPVEA